MLLQRLGHWPRPRFARSTRPRNGFAITSIWCTRCLAHGRMASRSMTRSDRSRSPAPRAGEAVTCAIPEMDKYYAVDAEPPSAFATMPIEAGSRSGLSQRAGCKPTRQTMPPTIQRTPRKPLLIPRRRRRRHYGPWGQSRPSSLQGRSSRPLQRILHHLHRRSRFPPRRQLSKASHRRLRPHLACSLPGARSRSGTFRAEVARRSERGRQEPMRRPAQYRMAGW